MLAEILLTLGVMALVEAALVDLRRRIIPNRDVLLIVVCGISLRLLFEPELIWWSLLAAMSVLVALGLLAHHEWIGGGDVKLIAAVTLLFPLHDIGELLLGIAIAGGLMGGAYLAIGAMLTKISEAPVCLTGIQSTKREPENLFSVERLRILGGGPMPYALAVLGSVIFQIVLEVIQCSSATFCSL